jgi:hypothetical protein
MEEKKYNNTYNHYDDFMDAHKLTGKLFGVIPFWFRAGKSVMAIFMATSLLIIQYIFSFNWIGLSIAFVLFLLFSLEYNRVLDLRDEIFTSCVQAQLTFERELERDVPQLEDAPDYIDYTDITIIFEDAFDLHKNTSRHIFQKMFGIFRK